MNFTVGVTPAVTGAPGNSLAYSGSIAPSLGTTVATTFPTTTAGVLATGAWTNVVGGAKLTCSLSALPGATPFAAGATTGGVPGTDDITVVGTTPAHPGGSLDPPQRYGEQLDYCTECTGRNFHLQHGVHGNGHQFWHLRQHRDLHGHDAVSVKFASNRKARHGHEPATSSPERGGAQVRGFGCLSGPRSRRRTCRGGAHRDQRIPWNAHTDVACRGHFGVDTVQFNVQGTTVGNSQVHAPPVGGNATAIAAVGTGVTFRMYMQVPLFNIPQPMTTTVTSPAALTCTTATAVGIPFRSRPSAGRCRLHHRARMRSSIFRMAFSSVEAERRRC